MVLGGAAFAGFTIAAISHLLAGLVSPPKQSVSPASGHVFPFRFGWQSVFLTGFAAEPTRIILGLSPGYIDYWSSDHAPFMVIRFMAASIFQNAGEPLIKLDLKPPDGEGFFNDYATWWAMAIFAAETHNVEALWDHNHFRTGFAILEHSPLLSAEVGRLRVGWLDEDAKSHNTKYHKSLHAYYLSPDVGRVGAN